jgi:hypothetical protein
MKKRVSSDELLPAVRRALALGYAAIDSANGKRVREAQRLIMRVLGAVDEQLLGGEVAVLVKALRRLAAELTGLEQSTA